MHRVFHSIRFKVNKGWSTAVLLFLCPYVMRAKQNKRVLLGMSGGTDSSVAAIILQDAGYEVTGITFRFYEKDAHTEYLDDAAELCTRLHIPHLVYDAREIFQQRIITYFINEYLKGRTPVPCTLCNNLLKWPLLQQVADEQDIYHIATGHYVQKVLHNGRWHISAGSDPDKDQSFFLWGLSQETLQRMLLPMGNLTKKEVRALAAERGFTKMAADVTAPGTFLGIREKIPYLKELGINAIEMMPIFEFDELSDRRIVNGKEVLNYWGYNTVSFFAPNTSYASAVEYNREGLELKELIKALHENGIEVILDVVFNHTAEGNEDGPFISFKGFDNNIYYLLTPEGYYYNFSGCGNTMNCNHPVVQRMIIDCLRYWVTTYRVDGFRFDLASILGRNEDGSPMENPPLLQALARDSILADTKLIAEAWDAGGLYQVGDFPAFHRWSEWNGRYRDDLREYLKGGIWCAAAAARRITGSLDLYDPAVRGRGASVNFINCHDGFTLYDLYAYYWMHNEANGW